MNIVELKKNITKYFVDIIKWFTSIIFLFIVLIINHNYQNINLSVRVFLFFLIFTLIIFIISSTNKGRKLFSFIYNSRIETQKVIWPSYKDTLNTTLIIIIIITIISFIFFILDNFLIYLISFLAGTRL
ncbi:preprotein translocase subunit SecE [Enterobacteriaceae endosymbiont of Donacia bicoloricornis]|uniref:preprotein translocase subunit SecE n=1 Tax=Enterobacteriaceae endosymbiont of Donacia bicoloricornis TaxID=2675772 RepID=UPI001448CF5E|nr:preprotein translocase subunit SecE [Enterobacteriaceae endosymbiont of Donacia bicoloricornis]QJC37836.1 preprotein translocase subunit SecE [Enterobacteriaceae endosymbiont of Donacia bicoloricornis]